MDDLDGAGDGAGKTGLGGEGALEDAADVLEDLLGEIAGWLDADVDVEVTERDGVLTGTLDGPDAAHVIGRRGETIEAIQHLARVTVTNGMPYGSAPRVAVDAGGYRERRQEIVRREADSAADEAESKGRPVALGPMTASERRAAHEHLRDRGGVATHSEGDEPRRHLVVTPED